MLVRFLCRGLRGGHHVVCREVLVVHDGLLVVVETTLVSVLLLVATSSSAAASTSCVLAVVHVVSLLVRPVLVPLVHLLVLTENIFGNIAKRAHDPFLFITNSSHQLVDFFLIAVVLGAV